MSFVIVGGERFALEIGDTVLGGRGAGALEAEPLLHLPPFAVVQFPLDGPSTIRATGTLPVTVNDVPLGSEPVPLRHGDHVTVDGLVIAVGDMRAVGRTAMAAGPTEELPLAALAHAGTTVPTASTGGRLVRLSDRAVHPVPDAGLTIGREPTSTVVLASRDVSRTHAGIAPTLLGYRLTDLSTNGVWVNGVRVEGSCVLGQHDVIRIGHEEFRFEADSASFEPAVAPAESAPPAAIPAAPTGPARSAPLLASLEVLSAGPLQGTRYRIDRSTVQLGRGSHNDVQLANDSVSGSHASLVQMGSRWTVLDLGSRNGTYVDGAVVRGQRELPPVCELRLGALVLVFRAINVAGSEPVGTIGVFGLTDAQLGDA